MEQARGLGLDPVDLERASISNLRTIIRSAKDALKDVDTKKLATVFKMAGNLTTSELRLRIGVHRPEELNFEKVSRNGLIFYRLMLTAKQFDRIEKSTRSNYVYKQSHAKRTLNEHR
jgi:hypothetical protein